MAAVATVAMPTGQRIVLRDVTWETYEQLLANYRDRSTPRFAYDRGVLEIASPTPKHEEDNLALAAVVATVAEELGVDFRPLGSTTFRREGLQQGFEADSSFYILNERFARDLAAIDPTGDPPPDLVIEVDVSRSSLDKMPIYSGLGVSEVCRCRADRVTIHALDGEIYREARESHVLPPLAGDVLTRLLLQSRAQRRLEWIQAIRSWARQQRREDDSPKMPPHGEGSESAS